MTIMTAFGQPFLEGLFPFAAVSKAMQLWERQPLGMQRLLFGFPVLFLMMGMRWALRRSRVERVLLLGTGPLATKVIDELEARPQLRCVIVGVVDDRASAAAALRRYPLLGSPGQLGQIVQELRPHRIIVALGDRRGHLPVLQLLEQRVRGLIIEEGEEAYERVTGKLAVESLRPGSLLFCQGFRNSLLQLAFARGVSLLCAVAGLLALAPLLALIAALIKIDSEGPVLFRQRRVGLGGEPFDLFKFRTMHAATRSTSEWVADNHERITRIGEWLRRFRLDEFPQFVNILRGDMNLVGPRPHPLSNFELFTEQIPFYCLRYLVRPGLTGWAQVRYGYANNLIEETEKVRYDLYYIKHRSAWLDLQIIPATMRAVLAGEFARRPPLAQPTPDESSPAPLDWTPGSAIPRPVTEVVSANQRQ
jgi:exopolysaccharide biosynthesis polyprenyl glycosylphosphotransferase